MTDDNITDVSDLDPGDKIGKGEVDWLVVDVVEGGDAFGGPKPHVMAEALHPYTDHGTREFDNSDLVRGFEIRHKDMYDIGEWLSQ